MAMVVPLLTVLTRRRHPMRSVHLRIMMIQKVGQSTIPAVVLVLFAKERRRVVCWVEKVVVYSPFQCMYVFCFFWLVGFSFAIFAQDGCEDTFTALKKTFFETIACR